MMRLRNKVTGAQMLLRDEKAARWIASGDYEAAPDDDQPAETAEPKPAPKPEPNAPTSIFAAIKQLVPDHYL